MVDEETDCRGGLLLITLLVLSRIHHRQTINVTMVGLADEQYHRFHTEVSCAALQRWGRCSGIVISQSTNLVKRVEGDPSTLGYQLRLCQRLR